MGFEGAVRLGFRQQVADDPSAFQRLVDLAYERAKAVNVAQNFDFDDIIDPASTRDVVAAALFGPALPRVPRKNPVFSSSKL